MSHRTIAGITAATLGAVLALAAFAPRGAEPPVAAPAAPPRVHEVRMLVEGPTSKFEPATVTINAGDQVRFVNVSGGPHNVSFDPATIPADMHRVLDAAMPDQIQPLWGPLLVEAGGSYTISFAGVKPGRYPIFCVPHMYDRNGGQAAGMKGTIIVR